VVLGLSDHTSGHVSVLGAVALGARVIEKHFTDDNTRDGPDHKFSMNFDSWKEMVEATRDLEMTLGDGEKKIELNETETVMLQRRALRLSRPIKKGVKLKYDDISFLRPCPIDAIPPYEIGKVIDKILKHDLSEGQHIRWSDIE
jgi:N-acetylneuraminate synthase